MQVLVLQVTTRFQPGGFFRLGATAKNTRRSLYYPGDRAIKVPSSGQERLEIRCLTDGDASEGAAQAPFQARSL